MADQTEEPKALVGKDNIRETLFGFVSDTETIEIRGTIFHCKGMSNKEVNAITKSANNPAIGQVGLYADVVIAGLVDPDTGENVFVPKDKSQVLNLPFDVTHQLAKVIMRLSGMGQEVDEMEADIAKGF